MVDRGTTGAGRGGSFTRYLPRLAVEWTLAWPGDMWRSLDATLVFADVSGFTSLSERLARRGRVGAEELTDVLGACFSRLLALAYADAGSLLKFGGDALLLLFDGPDHAVRGCRAAQRMRREMRALGRVATSVGVVRLRMSVGVHSGEHHFFRVGGTHRELIVTGPGASAVVGMESAADAGEILVSPATAAAVGGRSVGAVKGPGHLLRDVTVDLAVPGAYPAPPDAAADVAEAIPVALRPHLLTGALEPEHRNASVAFVHFDGVDARLARSGPGAVAEALDELVRRTQAACAAEEVTFLASDIDRDGGKLILVAGVPRALGDDEGRVLRAVRRIADGPGALPVRIGVNRGHVFAGEIGPSYRRTYTVMGDAVNLAARLMAAARPGQILATAGVLERSTSVFALEALPPFSVKGKARPVQAFAVGAAEGRGRRAPAPPRPAAPLVGRDAELAVLLDAVDAARRGTGRLVEVVGEPGIGKSRLVEEVRQRAADLRILGFTCEVYQSSSAYHAVGEVLREALGLTAGAGPAATAGALAGAVAALAPALEPWLPLLGAVLEVDLPATPATASLETRFRRERTRDATVELLAALLPSPTLVLLEDVQWMDEASADLVGHLAARLEQRPWAVLVTRREGPGGFRPPAPATAAGTAASVALGPLGAGEAAALVAAATDESPLRPAELSAVLARGGGNPLFLEELLRSRAVAADTLPETLDEVVSVQIDRLPPSPRRLLQFAAVLGTGFPRQLLAAVVGDDLIDDLGRTLAELTEFVDSDGPELRFRHRLIRDVAYQGLSFRRRRALHARAGDAIERSSRNPAAEHGELLSLHFLAAQRHPEAWRYSLLAARRAQHQFANVDAAELYERAVTAAQQLPTVGSRELAAVWEALGDVRQLAGQYAEATVAYRAARRLLGEEPVELARLCLKQSRASERLGRYSGGVRWARRGMRLLEGLDDPEAAAQRAHLGVWYAAIRQRQGRHHEAIRWCRLAIDEANRGGDRDALARAYRVLDWAYVDLGQLDRATNSAAALRIYEELGDLSGQAEVLNNLGGFAYYQGRWEEALELYARHGEAKRRTGNEVDAAASKANMAEILAEQGRLDEAEAHLRDALRTWRAVGYDRLVAFATMHLGRIAARRGRHSEALELLERAHQRFAALEAPAEALECDIWLAECFLLQRDPVRALAVAGGALRREAAMGGTGVRRATLERIRGYAFAQLGRAADAWAALDESLAVARARGAAYEAALTFEALSVIAPLGGRPYRPPAEEHRLVLDRLGVRWLPAVPVPHPHMAAPTAEATDPAPAPG